MKNGLLSFDEVIARCAAHGISKEQALAWIRGNKLTPLVKEGDKLRKVHVSHVYENGDINGHVMTEH